MASVRDPAHPAWARSLAAASGVLLSDGEGGSEIPLESVQRIRSELRERYPDRARLNEFISAGMAVERQGDGRHLDVTFRSRNSEEALVMSWALAEGVADTSRQELRDRFTRELSAMREEAGLIDEEWRMLIQQRLEFTDDLGVATAIQGREGDGFIQRLIIETEEEISRLETRRLELSKVINSQEIRRKLDSRESIRTSEPEGTDKPSCKELHAELMRARLGLRGAVAQLAGASRILGIREKILAIEEQLVELSQPESSQDESDVDHNDLVQEYREIVLKIETLRRRGETFARNLKNLEQLHPDLNKIDSATAVVKKRLAPIRERIAVLEWSLAQGQGSFATVQPESARATIVIPPGAGMSWKLIAAAIGCLFGLLLGAIFCKLDTHLYSDREVREILKLPVLAKIPRLSRREIQDPEAGLRAGVRERFNAAATVVRSVARELDMKVFAVTSATDGGGQESRRDASGRGACSQGATSRARRGKPAPSGAP